MKNDGFTDKEVDIINQVNQMLEFISQSSVSAHPLDYRSENKMYVCLAYEMFLLNLEERAFEILSMADPEYFKEPLGEDMVNDERFKTVVLTIMNKLVEIGVVKVSIS